MANKPNPPAQERAKPIAKPLVHHDAPHAPIVYFQGAPNFGHMNGIINITLTAIRSFPAADGKSIDEDVMIVAYLRGNIPAALALRKAIDDALLLAQPAGGTTQ